jgi:formylglycine-generating enzyme required for sulfatase activity
MRYIITILVLIVPLSLPANNLAVSNLLLSGRDSLQLDVSWANSWRMPSSQAPSNHDAIWLFAKYKTSQSGWEHLHLSSFQSDHAVEGPSALELKAVQDGMGLFIRRADTGSGDISPTGLTLTLQQSLPQEDVAVRVYGIEMVYVKQGAFYAGDSVSNSTLRNGLNGGPVRIAGSDKLTAGNALGSFDTSAKDAPAVPLPADFPNGYDGFYCMKYEISQMQYAQFLNTLTYQQQQKRTIGSPSAEQGTLVMTKGPTANRNGIAIEEPGVAGQYPAVFGCDASQNRNLWEEDDGMPRACNYLNWSDVAAYLDWAGLRPMTELEFEKVCRGPQQPVKKELAWGTEHVVDANTVVHDGTNRETVTEAVPADHGLASHGYTGPPGPLRCGFAGSDTTERLTIGASYYGALEMSGNLWELCIVLNQNGIDFTGQLGDGELSNNGFADEQGWTGQTGNAAGHKGGAWQSGILPDYRDLAVSDRYYIYLNPNQQRRETAGGRGVRQVNW